MQQFSQTWPLTCRFATLYYGYMRSFLSANEVSKLINVDRATVGRWIKKGMIKGVFRPEGTQQWRIPLSAYQELRQRKETAPADESR